MKTAGELDASWEGSYRLRKAVKGAAPSALRLRMGIHGDLQPPAPEKIVARMTESKFGFTHFERGWMHGTWYCGTRFKPSSYWGQFPGNFLIRVMTMFPTERMLHLCSGHSHIPGAVNVDVLNVPSVDVQADVEALPFANESFAVVLIDPPYSEQDANRYGVKRLVSSQKALAAAGRVLVAGGYLLWLDERYPSFRRRDWHMMGAVGILTGFERRTRVLSMFRKRVTQDIKLEPEVGGSNPPDAGSASAPAGKPGSGLHPAAPTFSPDSDPAPGGTDE